MPQFVFLCLARSSTVNGMNINPPVTDPSVTQSMKTHDVHSLTIDSKYISPNDPFNTQQQHQKREDKWKGQHGGGPPDCRWTGCRHHRQCQNCWGSWVCMEKGVFC